MGTKGVIWGANFEPQHQEQNVSIILDVFFESPCGTWGTKRESILGAFFELGHPWDIGNKMGVILDVIFEPRPVRDMGNKMGIILDVIFEP